MEARDTSQDKAYKCRDSAKTETKNHVSRQYTCHSIIDRNTAATATSDFSMENNSEVQKCHFKMAVCIHCSILTLFVWVTNFWNAESKILPPAKCRLQRMFPSLPSLAKLSITEHCSHHRRWQQPKWKHALSNL